MRFCRNIKVFKNHNQWIFTKLSFQFFTHLQKKLDQHIFLFLPCLFFLISFYWGGRIRTCECRCQKPMPYHLATPHFLLGPEAFSKKRKWVLLHKVLTRFFLLFLKNFGLKTNITIFKKKIKCFDVFLESSQKAKNPQEQKVRAPKDQKVKRSKGQRIKRSKDSLKKMNDCFALYRNWTYLRPIMSRLPDPLGQQCLGVGYWAWKVLWDKHPRKIQGVRKWGSQEGNKISKISNTR